MENDAPTHAVLSLKIRNEANAIGLANEQAEAWLRVNAASETLILFANLAIEELVTNSLKYGYDDDGEHTVDVTLYFAERALSLIFIDDGKPFDPLTAPVPDLSLELEDRPIGGLGIYMLQEMADSMRYARQDGLNHVTLIKSDPR